MEETVRNLLQSQGPPEQKKEETVNIMVYQVHHMSYSWLGTGQLVLLRFLSLSVHSYLEINKKGRSDPRAESYPTYLCWRNPVHVYFIHSFLVLCEKES